MITFLGQIKVTERLIKQEAVNVFAVAVQARSDRRLAVQVRVPERQDSQRVINKLAFGPRQLRQIETAVVARQRRQTAVEQGKKILRPLRVKPLLEIGPALFVQALLKKSR